MNKLDSLINRVSKNNIKYYILVCAFIIFILINTMFSPLLDIQLDITQNKINTLSEDTKSVINEITSPVEIKLFYSTELSNVSTIYSSYLDKVKNTLIRYKNYNPDKISIQFHYIENVSSSMNTAIDYGLTGIPITKGISGYFGIVMTNEINEERVIPLLNPYMNTSLEYTLTKTLLSLASLKKPLIGIIGNFTVLKDTNYTLYKEEIGTNEWGFAEMLKEFYTVIQIPLASLSIPDGLEAIIAMNPTSLNKYASYSLEQYLLRGGKMLLMLDNYSKVSPVYYTHPYKKNDNSFDNVAKALGIELEENSVIMDLMNAYTVYQNEGFGDFYTSDINWIDFNKNNFNLSENIMKSLEVISLHSAGSIKISENNPLTVTELIKSSEQAALLDRDILLLKEDDLESIKSFFKPGDKSFLVAARLSGNFKSFYETPPKLHFKFGTKEKEHLKESISPTDIVVISDSDFAYDHYWNTKLDDLDNPTFQYSADNGSFIMNVIDEMTGNTFLTELRNKRGVPHPFYKLKEYEDKIISKYSKTNKDLFDKGVSAQRAIQAINLNANMQGKALTLEEIQNIKLLESASKRIETEISLNNIKAQDEITNFTNLIINLNLFLIPVIIVIISLFRILRRNINASKNS